jgi:hypothetical protein
MQYFSSLAFTNKRKPPIALIGSFCSGVIFHLIGLLIKKGNMFFGFEVGWQ